MDARTGAQIHADLVRNKPRPKKRYRPRHRRMLGGVCTAALRAVTAAKLHLDGKASSLDAAAISCGTCRGYVRDALIVLQSENATLLERVLFGHLPLPAAAKQARRVAALVDAYRS